MSQPTRSSGHYVLVAAPTTKVGWSDRKTWWRDFREPRPVRLWLAGTEHTGVARALEEDGVRVLVTLGEVVRERAGPRATEQRGDDGRDAPLLLGS